MSAGASHGRVAIIGAGHVGSTAAYALMLRALFREIVLIDSNAALARAEAADLSDANALARPARIWAGTYADAGSAQIAVLTAGAATHGAQSRLEVVAQSAEVVGECARQLAAAGFKGIVLVAANPVDLMALVAFRNAGLPAARVIGTGTLLDSSRLRQALAAELAIAPGSIEGMVVGEHGDSEVTVFSSVRIGAQTLGELGALGSPVDQSAIAQEVRSAGYEIIAGKGYTSFGIATAIVRICEAIVRDERVILLVSSMLTGQLSLAGLYLSLPCVLGAGGVERVAVPPLDPSELAGLMASATVIQAAIAAMDAEPAVPT